MFNTDFAIIEGPYQLVCSEVTITVYMNSLVVSIDRTTKKDKKYL